MKTNTLFLRVRIGLVFLLAFAAGGCFSPRPEILSQQLNETVVKTAGEDDYSIKYTVRVRNKGATGRVRLMAKLYTEEGQFYRERIVSLRASDDEEFEFVFTEPTVLGALFSEGKVRGQLTYETVR